MQNAIDDALVSADGAALRCRNCARPFHTSGALLVPCPRCATTFQLEAHQVPLGGAPVQCTRCQHLFHSSGDELCARCGRAQALATPGRLCLDCTTAQLPPPSGPPDESYRGSEGRMIFGTPGAARVLPLPSPEPPPPGSAMVFGVAGALVPIRCPACSLEHRVPERWFSSAGNSVSCSRCLHVFFFDVAPLGRAARAPTDDRVMFFAPTQPLPAPGSDGGRPPGSPSTMVFGTPAAPPVGERRTMVFGSAPQGATPSAQPSRPAPQTLRFSVPPPAKPPPPPRRPADPAVERLLAQAADALDDEAGLRVVSDGLMELGDPRGRLIAFMLDEEKGSEVHRKVKVNVLIRDGAPTWAPPGATLTAFRRGLPTDVTWDGPTDPDHVAWRTASAIHVTSATVLRPSVFDADRPRLRAVTGVNLLWLQHLAQRRVERIESVGARVVTAVLDTEVLEALRPFTSLRSLSVRTVDGSIDDFFQPAQLRRVLEFARDVRLEMLRLPLPRMRLDAIDLCLAAAPKVEVHFALPYEDSLRGAVLLGIDPRKRLFLVPRGAFPGHAFKVTLENLLGQPLQEVRAR